MKTAIYIEDGVVQLVLTPESDFEKNAIKSFESDELETKIFSGAFYDCRGGWVRQNAYYQNHYNQDANDDRSIILRTSKKEVNNDKN